MKIAIQTLGCKVNQSESAQIEGVLRNNNYEIVKPSEDPDVCIVNTCTVTAKSDYQSRQLIRKAARSGARVIAAGCYAQLKAKEISDIEGLDLVVGNSGKDNIVGFLKGLPGKNGATSIAVDQPAAPLISQPYYSDRSRAFLKIQDGCNFSCSYCAVPRARGRSRSLDVESVMESVDNLNSAGYREIVLTGIHIGLYGYDLRPKSSLVELINRTAGEYGNIRFRISSLEPQEVTEELMQLLKKDNIFQHLHIPLQSGSDRILHAMSRGYSADYYKQVINSIITDYPDISIGTDLITGFPGESDKDFNDTVKFIQNLPLSYFHVFPYSNRPGTKSSMLSDQVSDKVKKDRVKSLIEISYLKKKTYISRHIGHKLNVIVEKRVQNSKYYHAISDNYLRVIIQSNSIIPGENVKVRVISLTDNGLEAEVLK